MRHSFNFMGGDDLTTMGASWFVSYAYYEYIDKTHLNWKNVGTWKNRLSVYQRTRALHKYWMQEVTKMEIDRLSNNRLGIPGIVVQKMALALIGLVP